MPVMVMVSLYVSGDTMIDVFALYPPADCAASSAPWIVSKKRQLDGRTPACENRLAIV